jgi:twinkle protein
MKSWDEHTHAEKAEFISYLNQRDEKLDRSITEHPIVDFTDVRHAAADVISPEWMDDAVLALHKTGIEPGVSPGWPSLASHWTLRPCEWTLVTGIPSHGKSSLMNAVMVNTAKQQGWNWLVWSAENLPHELHVADLLEQYHAKPFNHGFYQRISEAEIRSGLDWLGQHFRFLSPPEGKETIPRLIEAAESMAPWANALYIDPWNELTHSWSEEKISETEYVSRSLKQLRRYAARNSVHVVVVAHPKMLTKDKDGKYPIPTPYDVAGSAHWRNKADCALTVWRDESQPGETMVYVQKIRRRAVGKIGAVPLKYDVVTGRFSEPVSYDRQPGYDDE